MGDGSMMTLSIADPEKKGISEYLKSLPSRNPIGCPAGPIPGIGSGYMQNGVEYPSPYDYSIYTDYLKALQLCIPPSPKAMWSANTSVYFRITGRKIQLRSSLIFYLYSFLNIPFAWKTSILTKVTPTLHM